MLDDRYNWVVRTPSGLKEFGPNFDVAYQFFLENKNSWPKEYRYCSLNPINFPKEVEHAKST